MLYPQNFLIIAAPIGQPSRRSRPDDPLSFDFHDKKHKEVPPSLVNELGSYTTPKVWALASGSECTKIEPALGVTRVLPSFRLAWKG